jgi:hypothetical protein
MDTCARSPCFDRLVPSTLAVLQKRHLTAEIAFPLWPAVLLVAVPTWPLHFSHFTPQAAHILRLRVA